MCRVSDDAFSLYFTPICSSLLHCQRYSTRKLEYMRNSEVLVLQQHAHTANTKCVQTRGQRQNWREGFHMRGRTGAAQVRVHKEWIVQIEWFVQIELYGLKSVKECSASGDAALWGWFVSNNELFRKMHREHVQYVILKNPPSVNLIWPPIAKHLYQLTHHLDCCALALDRVIN